MIQQETMTYLFYLLYTANFVTNFVQAIFQNISMIQNQTNLAFYSILTLLKVICPAVGGFIIDQTQYSLNVLFISQLLSLLAYIFFFGFCISQLNVYIYFALGASILGEQLQTIMTLTMISKSYSKKEIQKQYGINYLFGVLGRFFCGFILYGGFLPFYKYYKSNIYDKSETDFVASLLSQTSSLISFGIPFIIQICVTICLHKSFKYFSLDARQKIPDLLIPIKANTNLLGSLKAMLGTDISVTAFATVHLLSVIVIWENYEIKSISNLSNNQWIEFSFKVLPTTFQLSQIMKIANTVEKDDDFYENQKESIKQSLVQFLLGYIVYSQAYDNASLTYLFFGFLLLMFQQYIYAYLYITNITRIGQKVANFRTYGMSFGMFFMSINIYNLLVIISLSVTNGTQAFQLQMIIQYAFSFGYCFVGLLVMKILSFNKLFEKLERQESIQVQE